MLYNREVYIAQWRRIINLFYWKQRKITTVKKRNSKLKEKKRTIITRNTEKGFDKSVKCLCKAQLPLCNT